MNINWEASYANICRGCMTDEGELYHIYDNKDFFNANIHGKLIEIAGVEIKEFDGLPAKLCLNCIDKINAFFEFKQQVQVSDSKLRQIFHVATENTENDISIINEIMTIKTDSNEAFIFKNDNFENNDENEIKFTNFEFINSDEENDVDNSDINLNIIKSEALEIASKGISNNFEDDFEIISQNIRTSTSVNLNTDVKEKDLKEVPLEKQNNQTSSVEYLIETVNVEDENNVINNENMVMDENNESIDENIIQLDNNNSVENFLNLPDDISDTELLINSNDNNDHMLGSLNDTITKIKEIRISEKVTQYQCTLCSQNYEKLSSALTHLVNFHIPSSGPFYCVVCEKDCNNIRELKDHVKLHDGKFPYKCFLCNKAYMMRRYLKRHMICHTNFPRFRCSKCGLRFKFRKDLDSHIPTHTQTAPYSCNLCSKSFNHKGNYKRHLVSHLDPRGVHLPRYPCLICNRRFINNRTLETHMRVHTGEKPYKCEICNKYFSQKGNLKNHYKIHTNPRSFTCEVCGKSFNQKATLKDHSLLHSGEKPHVCTICGMTFTFSSSLRRHMYSHSDGKPYQCQDCNAQFVGKYDLTRHMKTHTNNIKIKPNSKNNKIRKQLNLFEISEEIVDIDSLSKIISVPNTISVDHVLICDDSVQLIPQGESEKENVNSFFNLIEYE